MNNISLLDCTLRDGGYYNNWDFPDTLVNEYLSAVSFFVDYIEIGFRSLDFRGFKGALAYTTDEYLHSLSLPKGARLGVMVNAAELINYPRGQEAAIEKLFTVQEVSPIDFVRVACHAYEVEKISLSIKCLREKGYQVGLNIMQIAQINTNDRQQLSEYIYQFIQPDVLYFADSLGSLKPAQIKSIVDDIRAYWSGEVGIHAHDNMGNALANTLTARDIGVSWLDSTMLGMGRGPGNARTEDLIVELDDALKDVRSYANLIHLIKSYFEPLKTKYQWGSNTYYYLAGKYDIHPTYIQEMLSDLRYEHTEILSVIQHLHEVGGRSYSEKMLEDGRQVYSGSAQGSWKPAEDMQGRDVLVLGTGPSVQQYKAGIEEYIRKHQPLVIALNTISSVDEQLINYRAACHPFRLFSDSVKYQSLQQPLIVPYSQLDDHVRQSLSDIDVLDFGLQIIPDSFEFYDSHVIAPSPLVLAYVLGLCSSANVSRMLMAGFDGYESGDARFNEIEILLTCYEKSDRAIPLQSITPTTYHLNVVSLFAPLT